VSRDLPSTTDLLRPSAEKAKPEEQTSDALCRATSPRLTGSNPGLPGTPKGVLAYDVVRRHLRRPCRARHTELAACLRRRAPSAPERLPSVRSRSCDPAGEVALVVHSRAFTPHPVTRSEPCLPRQRLVGRLELSALPGSSRVAPRLTAPARKMRLSDFCNRLTIRAPNTLPDSRSRSLPAPPPFDDETIRIATNRPSAADPSLRPCRHTDLRPSGGASLDGESPASASPQPAKQLPRASPGSPLASSTTRNWLRSLDRTLLRAVPPDHGLLDREPSVQLGL
jgi:hypothetical protein